MKHQFKPRVVILAGGKGMRMKELTKDIPKAMVVLQGKPIIHHIIECFRRQGYERFIIAAGYKGKTIKEYFKNDMRVNVVMTGENASTGRRIQKIKQFVDKDDYFFVCYADGLSDINFNKMETIHKKKSKLASMVVVRPRSQFGILKFKGNLITEFTEKPILPYWINAGFFIFNNNIFNHLNNDMFENTTLPALAKKQSITAIKHKGFWKCMDTFKDYAELNKIAKKRLWAL